MTNRRMITSNLFEDDFIGGLNLLERLLWIGLITAIADDQGRMLDNTIVIRARIFMFDPKVTDAQVESGLCKLAAGSKITRYTAANKHLIQIVKWWCHQTPAWAAPSIYAAPPEWQDRIKCHVGKGNVTMFEWGSRGGYTEGYVGRYVLDYVPDHVSRIDMPINDVKVKEEVKVEGEGEIKDSLGVKAPAVGVDLRVDPGRTHGCAPTAASEPPARPDLTPPPPGGPSSKVVPENQIGLEVVCELAHWATIPGIHGDVIDHNLAVLMARYPEKEALLSYCRRFAEEYYRRYPARTSVGWLDWAMMGNIPEQRTRNRYGSRGKGDSGMVYPPRQHLSAEEIAEGIAILEGK
jgi:hypothetical protein